MSSPSSRKAPVGHVCCHICHRYRPPEKMTGTRCTDRSGCNLAAANMFGRPRRQSKKMLEAWRG